MNVFSIERTTSSASHDGDLLAEVEALYRQGQYVAALDRAEPLGPIESWRGVQGRLLAARLSGCLGAPQLSHLLYRLAFREHPSQPRAAYYYGMGLMRRRGPLAALEFLGTHSLGDADRATRADWEMLRARVFNAFRDFQRTDHHIQRAEQLAPARPWIHVEKANLLFGQDLHDAAVAAVTNALTLHPTYRPGIQLLAYFLLQLNRDDEAHQLLHRAALQLQSGDVWAQLAGLELELGMFEEADEHYQAAAAAFRLLELDDRESRWLAGRQSDAAYHLGDFERAAAKARIAEVGFYATVAKRLRDGPRGQRVVLPVPFIRQHHDTCAPATLAAISNFWGTTVAHADVVDGICYDGTPAHHERQWAHDHGFLTRAFRVTEASTKALLDRGIPFTLTTINPHTAHLQVVIGYDERRGTMLIRDPAERHVSEFVAEELLGQFASTGPRGLAIWPALHANWLDDVELQDAELYELFDALERHLQEYDRAAAERILRHLEGTAPEHRLTLHARAALANHDADPFEVLKNIEQLLSRYPSDDSLRLRKLACLSQLGRHQERREMLEEIVANDQSDPIFALQLCQELMEHASEQDRAETLLHRGLRQRPTDASLLRELSKLRWRQRRREESFELIRLAACAQEKNEQLAQTLFTAARLLDREDEAITFLRDRHARFVDRSTSPACTLARALELMGQTVEAMALLEDAMSRHPDDGPFMLTVAKTCARYGRHRECQRLLAAAEARCERAQWLRAKLELASTIGLPLDALACWNEVLDIEPLALDAHQRIVALLNEQLGSAAARAHLAAYVERFPTSHAIRLLQIEELRTAPAEAERAIRSLLQERPNDAWAYRELAVGLGAQGKWADAKDAVIRAHSLDRDSPISWLLRAEVHVAFGEMREAKSACRSALRVSVDYEPAIEALISLCTTRDDRRQEIDFIREQLDRQPFQGPAIFTYCRAADGAVDDVELLQVLGDLRHRRLDLWQAWAANIRWLVKLHRLEDAIGLAQQMIDRFPLHPSGWLQLSYVLGESGETDQQLRVLKRALSINPTWAPVARTLAELLLHEGRLQEAQQVASQSLIHAPHELDTVALLASIYEQLNQHKLALELLTKLVALDPGYEWAWQMMRAWGPAAGSPELAVAQARRLARERPHQARSWFLLAESLTETHQRDECLFALDQVINLNPRHVDAHAMKARLLSSLGLHADAILACQPEIFGEPQPLPLQACQAEISGH